MSETLTLVDPTTEPSGQDVRLPAKLTSLAGKRIGLLGNSKRHAAELLRMVGEELKARHGISGVVFLEKPDAGRIASNEILRELAETCDAAVAGVGD